MTEGERAPSHARVTGAADGPFAHFRRELEVADRDDVRTSVKPGHVGDLLYLFVGVDGSTDPAASESAVGDPRVAGSTSE